MTDTIFSDPGKLQGFDLSTINLLQEMATIFAGKWESYLSQIKFLPLEISLTFSIAAVIFGLEILFVGFRNSSLSFVFTNKYKTAINDMISSFIVNIKAVRYIGILLSFGTIYFISNIIQNILSGVPKIDFGRDIYNLIFFLVVVDFVGYWAHRALHRVKFLWELHRIHHSASQMTLFTTERVHPVETAVVSFSLLVPGLLMVAPADFFVAYFLLSKGHSYIAHSNLPWSFGWFGRYILVSPLAHRLHHATEQHWHDRNFSGHLQIWDLLFGTFAPPTNLSISGIPIGLADDDGSTAYPIAVWNATCRSGRALAKSLSMTADT